MNTTSPNIERVTRGAGNRKPTEKYALFQQSKNGLTTRQNRKFSKESRNVSIEKKSISSSSDKQEENMDDEYILQLCKQQSFKNLEKQQQEQGATDDIFETANSTPEKAENPT